MFDEETVQHMVSHMNEDHVDAMRDYCHLYGMKIFKQDPKMLRIDSTGFEMLVNDARLRINFATECETAEQVRAALVALAKQARKQ
tara:strand:- start:23 stop:280 length:258 start_codon:yes stop_codon:yes gene_type:complete